MLLPLDVGHVLKFYDLGTLENVTKAYHGFVNETVFVQTSEGHFVLRRNHRRLNEESHRYRHAMMLWLNEQGFPAPDLLPTRDGETLLVLDGRSYEITRYISGHEYDPANPEHLLGVGEMLARYHHAISGFDAPPGEPPLRYNAHNVMALSERLLERDIMGELYDILTWYDTRAAHLRSILPDSQYENLPHLVIHGDIHRDNFLFVNNEVVSLLDYDQAAWDARIVDLADAIVGFASDCSAKSNIMNWGVYPGPFIEECADMLVASYQSVVPLTYAEIAALPIVIELLWLQGELGRVFSTPEGAPDYHMNVLEQGRWLSAWLNERAGHLVETWSQGNSPQGQHGRYSRMAAAAA
jgi:homoserine kinase type II